MKLKSKEVICSDELFEVRNGFNSPAYLLILFVGELHMLQLRKERLLRHVLVH